jgi:predicted acetyltransferase
MTLKLVKPSAELLPSYIEALREGQFSAMQLGFGKATAEEIEADPQGWLAKVNDPAPFTYTFKSGPSFNVTEHELLWITDGSRFLGTVALRYKGDHELINVYAGHVGMAIRPALLNQGYGPRAIRSAFNDLAVRARDHGLSYVYATCNPDNNASRRLIEHFGGVLEERAEDVFGTGPNLRYKISLG